MLADALLWRPDTQFAVATSLLIHQQQLTGLIAVIQQPHAMQNPHKYVLSRLQDACMASTSLARYKQLWPQLFIGDNQCHTYPLLLFP